ncbi:hypothetical protein [Shinella zoogloeoides]|uniref:Uncharacterized protein n=1 Tax=Shinella zoogloeoides TaxID=352475 RepID=A0A6N8TPP9_SHIZO|nr:hypothetical protein [Shinella zoogloeoides]MXO03124.1 hypothetical protein [Shinella zoogloeoides]UEX83118.1 hypothetical protein K8M09_07575 [Shinella zoogloeoides]
MGEVKRPIPLSRIADHIRSQHTLSPAIQKLIEDNRAHFESQRAAFHDAARSVIDAWQTRWAEAFNLDPAQFAELPAEVIEQMIATSRTMEACADIPGAKISVTFTSTVTVNGIPVPNGE